MGPFRGSLVQSSDSRSENRWRAVGRFIGNGGGAPGVNAEFRFEPAGDYTVIVLANSSLPAATQLLNDIIDRLDRALANVTPNG